MAASYPSSLVNFGLPKQNLTDIIQASDPNSLRDEVLAIETVIGTVPSLSTAATTSSSWYNDGRDYGSVNARLANIEAGIVGDTHVQYAKVAGGSTITPSTISTVGLTLTATSGQTADLQQWKNSSGTRITYVDSSGAIYSNGEPLGTYVPHFLLGGM